MGVASKCPKQAKPMAKQKQGQTQQQQRVLQTKKVQGQQLPVGNSAKLYFLFGWVFNIAPDFDNFLD